MVPFNIRLMLAKKCTSSPHEWMSGCRTAICKHTGNINETFWKEVEPVQSAMREAFLVDWD
jgi:hypothetical protein